MTFCMSHSFISDIQQHRICWLRPVKVLALEMGLPLMLHTWMYVPAQDTMSPYTGTDRHTCILLGNRCVAFGTLDGGMRKLHIFGSPSVHWCTEQRQALDAPWAGWQMIICWGPRWCKFDRVSRSQRCGMLTMLSDTLQHLCDPVAPAMQENKPKKNV